MVILNLKGGREEDEKNNKLVPFADADCNNKRLRNGAAYNQPYV